MGSLASGMALLPLAVGGARRGEDEVLEARVDGAPLRRQADLARDTLRWRVLRPDGGDHARLAERLEGVVPAGGRRLRREAPAPERAVDQVAERRLLDAVDLQRQEAGLPHRPAGGLLDGQPVTVPVAGVALLLPA